VRSGNTEAQRLIRNLDQIAVQARRAGEIIKRVRAFAQRGTPRLGPVDLPEVIREVLALVCSDLRHREIDVSLELCEALPPVVADPIQIGQALLNLVRNAIEAMDGAEPQERRLTITASTPTPNGVQVTVSDTGAGLPADLVSRIFDPFFTTKANGLGIGLSITRSIIELHRGRLWVQPGAQRGCTFIFTLPAAR
jgi:signal transduction histidine kinase